MRLQSRPRAEALARGRAGTTPPYHQLSEQPVVMALAEPAVVLRREDREPPIYVGVAVASLAIAIIGFAPTYWIPLFRGTLSAPLIVHLHAGLFFGWLTLFLTQATLATTGRLDRHRRVGLAGIAVATAMLFIGVEVATARLSMLVAAGDPDGARKFSIVPLMGIVVFAGMIAVAIANAARRPEVHKRVMLVATVGLLNAATGRIIRLFLAPPGAAGADVSPPVAFSVLPGLAADLLIVAAMIHDKRARGRVHPAYWIAGAVLLAEQLLRVPISNSAAWMAFTRWLVP